MKRYFVIATALAVAITSQSLTLVHAYENEPEGDLILLDDDSADALSDLNMHASFEPDQQSFADATPITVNKQYSDFLETNETHKYYRFTLDKPGYVSFKFSHEYIDDNRNYWDMFLFSADDINKELLSRSYKGKELKEVTEHGTGLAAGVYYVKIKPAYVASGLMDRWSSAKYDFTVEYEASSQYEMERNDNAVTANDIVTGKEYHGTIMENEDEDWYRLTIDKPGYVDFKFSHEFVNDDQNYWDISVYSDNDLNNDYLTRSFIGNERNEVTEYGTGLAAGTYYVVVRPAYSYYGWKRRWDDCIYHFTVGFDTSHNYEQEDNGSIAAATPIKLNTVYSGNIQKDSEKDYYKLELPRSGSVSFVFAHDLYDRGNNWEVCIYSDKDVNNYLVNYKYKANDKGDVTEVPLSLSAGKYYIKITGDSKPFYIYHFMIRTTLDVSVPVNPMIVGSTAKLSVSDSSGGELSYTSSNPSVVSVDGTGTLKALKAGRSSITVSTVPADNEEPISATVIVEVKDLAATRSLKATNVSKGIKLTYAEVQYATKYLIYRNNKLIATLNGGSKVSYTDKTSLKNGTKYTYKVVAATKDTLSASSKSVVIYRLDQAKLSSVKSPAAKKMTVKWRKNSKASGYQVRYSRSSDFSTGNKTVKISGSGKVSKTIKNLKRGKKYYVQVRSYKKAGGKTYYSEWSSKLSVKIKK